MNRHKKIAKVVCVLITALNIVACGQIEGESVISQQESNMQAVKNIEDVNDHRRKSEAESIQDEIAK